MKENAFVLVHFGDNPKCKYIIYLVTDFFLKYILFHS